MATGIAQADTTGNWYYLQGTINGGVSAYAHFGAATDQVLVGDWDGDGRDTLMLRRGNDFYVTNSTTGGATAYAFRYGSASDIVIVGDWNGDGKDTLGVRRGNEYFLSDSKTGGVATRVFRYGSPGDELLVGDWDGNGTSTFGVRRVNEYYLTNTQGGKAQVVAKFGSGGDIVIVGDWNADRKDTLGVRRGNQYHLANAIAGGRTNVINTFGSATDTSYVGDWNGDRVDTIAVRRTLGPPATRAGTGSYVVGSQIASGLYKGSAPAGLGCYWERVSDFSGSLESIVANDFWSGPVRPLYVEIAPSDAGFVTDDCGTWTEARDSDPFSPLAVADGQYRVDKDVAPGVYQAPGGDGCYWERVSSFDGSLDSVLANDFGASGPVVEINSTDVGFVSTDCGSWQTVSVLAPVTGSVDRAEVKKNFVQGRQSMHEQTARVR